MDQREAVEPSPQESPTFTSTGGGRNGYRIGGKEAASGDPLTGRDAATSDDLAGTVMCDVRSGSNGNGIAPPPENDAGSTAAATDQLARPDNGSATGSPERLDGSRATGRHRTEEVANGSGSAGDANGNGSANVPVPISTTATADVDSSPWVRRVTVLAVVVVALVAAVVSYVHQLEVAKLAGEGWRAWLVPASVDGMMVAASMTLLTARRNGRKAGLLAWVALFLGLVASLGSNVIAADPDLVDPVWLSRAVAAWPPLALALSFELCLQQLRPAKGNTVAARTGGPS